MAEKKRQESSASSRSNIDGVLAQGGTGRVVRPSSQGDSLWAVRPLPLGGGGQSSARARKPNRSRIAGLTQRIVHRGEGGFWGPRRNVDRRVILIVAMVAVAVIAGAIAGVSQLFAQMERPTTVTNPGEVVTVTIPSGASTADIAQILVDEGVITSTGDFKKAVKDQDASTSMKSGNYDFIAGSDINDIVRQLVAGPNSSSERLTIAEGLTVTKVAATTQDALGIPKEDFLAQAKASNYAGDYSFLADVGDDSLEGFLFPKTYDFGGKEVSADGVIRAMLDQHQIEVRNLDMGSAETFIQQKYSVTMGDYDILKLASIIEKEALDDDDRYKISSVMYNRLRTGMALQSDATMGYVTGGEVTAADLKVDSPYNTYLNMGLPPTPICTPSMESIRAAMDPADTNYYFFWITEDEHVFSETYEQHEQAIQNAQSQRQNVQDQIDQDQDVSGSGNAQEGSEPSQDG